MNARRLLVDGVTVFAVAFVVSVMVTLLWNLGVHRAGAIDWETSLRFAILLGILLPWMAVRRNQDR